MESVLKSIGFVHLHVHSAYSLREGALSIETLGKLAKADDMPALAITDTNNLFGALEFSEKLAKSGIQPIIGAQATVDFGDAAGLSSRLAEQRVARAPIVLLAQNEAGYRSLMRLVSGLWLDPKDGDEPHIPVEKLAEADGLIALTGGPSGPLDRALGLHLLDIAERRLARLAATLRRASLCRVAAPRARGRARRRAPAHWSRRQARAPARRDQRALFRQPLRP